MTSQTTTVALVLADLMDRQSLSELRYTPDQWHEMYLRLAPNSAGISCSLDPGTGEYVVRFLRTLAPLEGEVVSGG